MVSYKQLQREPASRALFNKRIMTIQGLCIALKDSAFLAIDTEHVAITSEKDRVLDQVGLAYLETLGQDSPRADITSPSSRPYLRNFYTEKKIQGLTLNISMRKERREKVVRLGGVGMPARRSHRFGLEQQIDLENLETAILDFVQSCNNKANLVLIGFEMAAEWEYLSSLFPQAMPLFSAWVDLRDIAQDVASSVGVIPGLAPLIQLFGYHSNDIQPCQRKLGHGGNADNAGDDAVVTCALAKALLLSENQEKLRCRQACGQIARLFTKGKRYQVPDTRDSFTVTIRCQGALPTTINSGMKLAREFFHSSPQHAGIMPNGAAFLSFRSQDQMDQFITSTHGQALPTGELLSVQRYSHANGAVRSENRGRGKEPRERKKPESSGSEVENLEDLFS